MPTFLRVLATAIEVLERESGRGREVPCSRSKERKSPGVDQDLKSEKVTTMGGSKAIAIDAEQRDTSPIHATPPQTPCWRKTSKWMKVKTTFLGVTFIYLETCSNLRKVM
jgi:hypothetical protein